ncbi:MAG: glycosyltransferase [Gammaproteobacteria bacterium]|nr:glycosyltransferase [Gammaproteobacteria bacterium]
MRIGYSSLDVFVHAARQGESFGMVLVESMLCETPVITLATPYADNSQVEVVGHEQGGLVTNNKNQFIKAMEKLFFDHNKRKYYAMAGRKRALENYSFQAVAESINVLTHELSLSNFRTDFVTRIRLNPSIKTSVSRNEIREIISHSFDS